jgi:hypothetical protein
LPGAVPTSLFAGLSLGGGLAGWRARGVDRRVAALFCAFAAAAFLLAVC